jgi:hypothetical protein
MAPGAGRQHEGPAFAVLGMGKTAIGKQEGAGHAALAQFSNLWNASRLPQDGRPLQGAHDLTTHA